MNRTASLVVALCVGLVSGCGNVDVQPDKKQVERRVAKLVGDNEGGAAEAKCAAVAGVRAYRCEVSVNAIASTYDATVSANGEKIKLKKH